MPFFFFLMTVPSQPTTSSSSPDSSSSSELSSSDLDTKQAHARAHARTSTGVRYQTAGGQNVRPKRNALHSFARQRHLNSRIMHMTPFHQHHHHHDRVLVCTHHCFIPSPLALRAKLLLEVLNLFQEFAQQRILGVLWWRGEVGGRGRGLKHECSVCLNLRVTHKDIKTQRHTHQPLIFGLFLMRFARSA